MKKHIFRVALVLLALIIGSLLGRVLLIGYSPIKISIFAIACVVLGNALHSIDKYLNKP